MEIYKMYKINKNKEIKKISKMIMIMNLNLFYLNLFNFF